MIFTRPDQVNQPLYICSVIFNPIRFRSRWKLYKDFEKHVEKSGAILYTAEVAFGEREFVLTEPNNIRHLQLRTSHELWLKENIINLLVQRLPQNWKYMAWIDADITFTRGDWANETLHQLQHYKVVQMWTEAHDLSPNYEVIQSFKSFIWCWMNNIKPPIGKDGYYYDASHGLLHPGFAWAIRRDTFNNLGSLIDWAILGGADLYMARALTNTERKLPDALGESGKRWLKMWTERADQYVNRNVGVMDGLILHQWHGKKSSRRYKDRGQILVDSKFDPEIDLKKDWQGLYQLVNENVTLRDGIRQYLRNRNEDGIDI